MLEQDAVLPALVSWLHADRPLLSSGAAVSSATQEARHATHGRCQYVMVLLGCLQPASEDKALRKTNSFHQDAFQTQHTAAQSMGGDGHSLAEDSLLSDRWRVRVTGSCHSSRFEPRLKKQSTPDLYQTFRIAFLSSPHSRLVDWWSPGSKKNVHASPSSRHLAAPTTPPLLP